MKQNKIIIEKDKALVILTKGFVAIIDIEDVPIVKQHSWRALVVPHTVYAVSTGPRPRRKSIRMHRLLMEEPEGLGVDHVDGNGLNNRLRRETANLRIATSSENNRNQRTQKRKSSGRKGVCQTPSGKWVARIKLNGVSHYLGIHITEDLAADAYAEASRVLHGSFGRVA